MTALLLVRHGATDHIGHVLSGWSEGVHLNAEGTAQAQALAARLRGLRVAAVYSSPLERTRETAALIAAPHGLTPRIEADAGEVKMGAFTGQSFEQLADDEHWRRWNRFRSGARVPGGEMMVEVQARIAALLQRLAAAHVDEALVLVSHADVIKAAVAHVLGSPLELMGRMEIAPASVTALAIDADSARVVSLNALP